MTANIVAREKDRKQNEIHSALEARYIAYKDVAVRAKKNLHIVESQLQEVKKIGNEQQIKEVQARADHYAKQNKVAQQNEFVAKRDMEQGA
jgi:hypothetical protein